jgi:hypothetical protein
MGDEMTAEERALVEMDARLVRAMEARPAVEIPAEFAARVAGQLPERRSVSLTPRHYGRNAMVVCMVVLGVALLGLALDRTSGTTLGVALEWFICAQFVALAMWLGVWRRGLR